MSVKASERKESRMEFINSAHELELLTIKLSLRENAIPKRYRYILGRPLCEGARRLNQCVTYANSIIPKTKEEYLIRERYQQKAMAELANMFELLRLASELLSIKDSTLAEWSKTATKEMKALKSWHQSDYKRYKGL